jgi:hypothetical protein
MDQTEPLRIVGLPRDVQEMIVALPQDIKDAIANLPLELQEIVALQPDYINRRDGAALVSRYVLKVAPRSLELWQLPRRRIGRQAMTPPIVLLAIAAQKRATGQIWMGSAPAAPSLPTAA